MLSGFVGITHNFATVLQGLYAPSPDHSPNVPHDNVMYDYIFVTSTPFALVLRIA
jgi:hypothetical protein